MKFIIFHLVSYLSVCFSWSTLFLNLSFTQSSPISFGGLLILSLARFFSTRQTAHETISVNLYKGTGTASLFHWSCLLFSLFADPETAINVGSLINQGDNINEGQKQELSSQGQDGKPITIIAR